MHFLLEISYEPAAADALRTSSGALERPSRRRSATLSSRPYIGCVRQSKWLLKVPLRSPCPKSKNARSTVKPSVVLLWNTVIFVTRGGEFTHLFGSTKRRELCR
jgi:hypothetical protein